MKKDRSSLEKRQADTLATSASDALPRHPGHGLLSSEDWVRVATRLQLTARELSVAVLLFEGKTRFQIARKLQCASGTVRVYIDRLFAKLNVKDRLGMVLAIVRLHLGMPWPSHKSATGRK